MSSNIETLRELVSCPREFHLYKNSPHPGLARTRAPDTFRDLHVSLDTIEGFVSHTVTEDTRRIFTPRDGAKVGKVDASFFTNASIIEAIEKPLERGIIIKVCFQDRVTGDIVLVTAHAFVPDTSHIPSVKDGWYILKCDMIAPGRFWNAIKARL